MTDVGAVIPYSPAHTPEKMLDEALTSVENQTVPTEPYVVVDEEQHGPAWARNCGLERTEERYVGFLDADDLWKPDKVERQLDRMNETGAGLCLEGEEMDTETFVQQILNEEILSRTPSILIDTHQVSVRFDESLERREDHLFMIEAALEDGVCFCADLVEVRKHPGGLTDETTHEMHISSGRELAERIQTSVPDAVPYLDYLRQGISFSEGTHQYRNRNYPSAIPHFVRSIRCNPVSFKSAKAAVFVLLCVKNYLELRVSG